MRIVWLLKQLLPLKYTSAYAEVVDGESVGKITTFRMWFRFVFNEKTTVIK